MTKTIIVTAVDHHGATKAIDRVTQLLDFSKDGYAVNNLAYRVHDYNDLATRIDTTLALHVGSATAFCVECDRTTMEATDGQELFVPDDHETWDEGGLRRHQAQKVVEELTRGVAEPDPPPELGFWRQTWAAVTRGTW